MQTRPLYAPENQHNPNPAYPAEEPSPGHHRFPISVSTEGKPLKLELCVRGDFHVTSTFLIDFCDTGDYFNILKLLMFAMLPSMCLILQKLPCGTEKNVNCFVFGWNVL